MIKEPKDFQPKAKCVSNLSRRFAPIDPAEEPKPLSDRQQKRDQLGEVDKTILAIKAKKRGRPATGNAMTGAERVKAHRAKQKAK